MEKNREKLFNAIIFFVQNTDYCHKLKLMKLLYYLDFIHFKQTGRSVTNLIYKAWNKGPVPTSLYYEIEPNNNPDDMGEFFLTENEDFTNGKGHCLNILPKKKFNSDVFSKRELKILEDVSYIFKEAKANDMTEASHFRNQPWHKTIEEKGEGETIDYELTLDNDPESLSFDELHERRKLDSEIRQLFE